MRTLESLFRDLRIVEREIKTSELGSVQVLYIESMTEPDLINCVIEVPADLQFEGGN